MRIDNPLASQQVEPLIQPATQGAGRPAATTAIDQASAHSPAPEILDLVSQLGQVPQIREEVVQAVAQRLASGQLLAPQSTSQTVQAIQDAARLGD
jgi:hypothetical protein